MCWAARLVQRLISCNSEYIIEEQRRSGLRLGSEKVWVLSSDVCSPTLVFMGQGFVMGLFLPMCAAVLAFQCISCGLL